MVKENVRVRVRVREGYSTNEQSYDGTADVARRENGREGACARVIAIGWMIAMARSEG